MTRFFSEVEIKKFDKKLNEDLLNSNERFKKELKGAIDEENHRSNVDRAKKKSSNSIYGLWQFPSNGFRSRS